MSAAKTTGKRHTSACLCIGPFLPIGGVSRPPNIFPRGSLFCAVCSLCRGGNGPCSSHLQRPESGRVVAASCNFHGPPPTTTSSFRLGNQLSHPIASRVRIFHRVRSRWQVPLPLSLPPLPLSPPAFPRPPPNFHQIVPYKTPNHQLSRYLVTKSLLVHWHSPRGLPALPVLHGPRGRQ